MTRITAILPEGVATHYIEANGPVRKKAGDGKATGTKPIASSLKKEKFKTISSPSESPPRTSSPDKFYKKSRVAGHLPG
jgi:hypothetical protein